MIKLTMLAGTLALAAGIYAQPPGPPPPRGIGPQGPGGNFLGAEVLRPGHVVKNAPFSADVVTEATQTLADGNRVKQSSTGHVYRDSEGRTRHEHALGSLVGLLQNANPRQVVFINDPVAGANYALDATSRTATKSAWGQPGPPPGADGRGPGPAGRGPGPRAAEKKAMRQQQNEKTEDLGTQTINGVQAQGTRITRTVAAGQMGNEQPIQIVSETWYSPDLQMVVLRKSSDPRRGEVVMQVQNISRSEPSTTLFQVPADFKLNDMAKRRPGQGR